MEVPDKQLRMARFWKKFLRLTRGRVQVLRALEVIGGEETDADLKELIGNLATGIMERGLTLSEAMAEYSSEFSLSALELIKTAEKTGAWDEILQELADGLQEGTFD